MNKNNFINYFFSLSDEERKEIIEQVDELDLRQNTKIYQQNHSSYLNRKEKNRLRGLYMKNKVRPGMFVKCDGTKDGFGIREVLEVDENGITARKISRQVHITENINVSNKYDWIRDSYITTHMWNKVAEIIEINIKNKMKMSDIKQVIIIRKDLNMSRGKMLSQGAHASMGVIFNYMTPEYGLYTTKNGDKYKFQIWLPEGDLGEEMNEWMTGMFKKIVVGAENLEELVNAYQEAKKQGLPCSLIEDKGLTEFGGKITITAAAIGPCDAKRIDPITKKFKLL